MAGTGDSPKAFVRQQRTRRGKAGWKIGPGIAVVDENGKIVEEYKKTKGDDDKKK